MNQEQTQQTLFAAVAIVRDALERHCNSIHDPIQSPPPTPYLDRLCTTFELTSFERNLLLLCVGMELDPTFSVLCAKAQNSSHGYPTFQLAMSLFPDAHWSALTPDRPLRRWRLIEVDAGSTLMLSPLRIDEWVLHFLMGIEASNLEAMRLILPIALSDPLVSSHQELAAQVADCLQNRSAVQLCGRDPISKQAIAVAACDLAGLKLSRLTAAAIPTGWSDRSILLLLWERTAALTSRALLLDCDIDSSDATETAIAQFIDDLNSPLIVSSRDQRFSQHRSLITLEVTQPTPQEQKFLWLNALDQSAIEQNGLIDSLVTQFNLSPLAIQAACVKAQVHSSLPLNSLLWDACRIQARPRMDELAQRIELAADWDDLVLPDKEKQILRSIAAHVRQRTQVYDRWGFDTKGKRGLGITALFAGASGTGKTMAAEVLARSLRLDLYRIDLSSVVSKYIGETEKNLRRVFDAAESGSVVLLFDEADALFGKRSEVKDSHDRYANLEVSYLLQRMELYQGLAILTTNLKDAIDPAFLRRIRFIVKFPFPEAPQREEMWRRVFPKQTPLAELDVNKLARLNVAGGNIRNIALNAAFLAADAGEAVGMKHLLEAARGEYAKLERSITDMEIKGWV